MYYDLKDLIIKNFGFGNFIFKDKLKTIEATNIEELYKGIETISAESLVYHASRNHFSNWLSVRGEFDTANQFRKLKNSHFDHIEDRRSYHLDLLADALKNRKEKFKLVDLNKKILKVQIF